MSRTDPGFSVEGGADPPEVEGGGNIRFYQVFQKMHEFQKILDHPFRSIRH